MDSESYGLLKCEGKRKDEKKGLNIQGDFPSLDPGRRNPDQT